MQRYTYGDINEAVPYAGDDGSRVISFFIFNTEVHLHVYASEDAFDGVGVHTGAQASSGLSADAACGMPATERLDAALMACRDRCRFFEEHLSRTRPDSDIARAHALSPEPVPVAPETAELVRLALGYCARSRGCFDITMGTVTSLWDFHAGVVPSRRALARACAHVGFDGVHVREVGASVPAASPTLSIDDPETVLDLGGIAKGYIADDLAGVLERHGVRRFVINLGGNVLVRGGRPANFAARPPVSAGAPWKVGIVSPRDPAHHRAIVDVADGSVVTSGLHERSFTRGGVMYHHILSPVDGMPARTDVASATIMASRSLDCDGYSTTVLMLGMERGLAFAEELDGVEAVLIGEDDEVRWTSGLDDRLALIPTLPRW